MELSSLPPDYKNTFSRYTGLLSLIGLHFFDEMSDRNMKLRLFIFNIIFLPFICGQFSLITKIRAENFLEGAQIVPVSVMFILDVIKMTTALLKKSDITEMLVEIGELWPRALDASDEKAAILEKWLKRMKVLLDSFYIYAVVNLTLFEVIPFLTTVYNSCTGVNEYVFPFRLPGLWEVNSTATYVATYLWEIAATVPCQICLYLPYDLLIVTVTSNVSVLLRLLQVDLENAVKPRADTNLMDLESLVKPDENRSLRVSDEESLKEIFRIVKVHQKLLRIAQQLSHIFGSVIFIHVAFSSVVICFFGFLTVVFGGVAETIANLLTVWNAVITIFLLSLSGQLLCDTSSEIADAAYKCVWYESDMKVKKLIIFIIIRSQRTSYLSALGFSNMTLRSFSKIMSSAWTYFSLLIQLYREN